jgi:hypothetical protein
MPSTFVLVQPGSPAKTSIVASEVWENRRTILYDLYIEQGLSLHVLQIMASRHDFKMM